jgi:beta-1,4-mannooligosaccharide/beta-1,4-mannosyl-N-acetylglucosamine phosphorylase
MSTIIGESLPGIPWQDKPAGCSDPMWRYAGNPVIGRNPLANIARIFNSATVLYKSYYLR